MSLVEKLLIRNTINSDNFLKNYFIGIFIYLGMLFALLLANIIWPGQITSFLIYGHTTFIFIHTLFLLPSLLTMFLHAKPKGPLREKILVVLLVNAALCIMALTISSFVFHR